MILFVFQGRQNAWGKGPLQGVAQPSDLCLQEAAQATTQALKVSKLKAVEAAAMAISKQQMTERSRTRV